VTYWTRGRWGVLQNGLGGKGTHDSSGLVGRVLKGEAGLRLMECEESHAIEEVAG
jgi:hypothetical protein